MVFELAAAIGVLLAWVGWGSLLNALLVRDPELDWGQKAAWGVAVLVGIGGMLNVTCAISRPLILIILCIGWGLWVADRLRSKFWLRMDAKAYTSAMRRNRPAVAAIVVAGIIIAVRFTAGVSSDATNIHDDHYAYLVFPARMLGSGCMGDDPFNHRRLVSALGGKSFLDTFILSTGTEYNLHSTDAGLGLLLIVGLLVGRCRRRQVSLLSTAGILLFIAAIPPPQVNMSALLLEIALLLSLFRTLDDEWSASARSGARLVLIAFTAAAAMTLKNLMLPPVVLSLVCSYAIYIYGANSPKRAVGEATACAALVILLVLPWMLSLLSSSGTLLYGILGSGYARYSLTAEYHSVAKTVELMWAAIANPDFLALIGLSLLTLLHNTRTLAGRGAALAITCGAGLAAIVVAVATAGPARTVQIGIHRYCFPFLMAAILVLLLTAAENTHKKELARFAHSGRSLMPGVLRAWAVPGVAALLCLLYVPRMGVELYRAAMAIEFWPQGVARSSADTVRGMQAAVPPGQVLVVRLADPFLLDFDRNPIYVIDHPAMVSPTPGMPTFKGGEALAQYLQGLAIRYVAFSYRTEANYSQQRFGERLTPQTHPAYRAIAAHVFDFNQSLQQLGRSRKRIYDDGDIFVLDLAQRV